MAKVNI